MKSILNSKNVFTLLAFLFIVVMLSSCNRGGYGCPYELEIANDVLNTLAK